MGSRGGRHAVLGALILGLAAVQHSAARAGDDEAGPGALAQRLQMLSHWDHSFPLGDQFPNHAATTRKYNPLAGTADGARTWTPNYPDQYVYRFIKINLEPVCNWPYNEWTGLYHRRDDCDDRNRTDIRVRMHIKYENQYGKRTSGMRCLGDSPDSDEAPDVWNGERDKEPNLRPFIMSVEDGEGRELKYSMHRSDKHWWLDYDFAKPIKGRMYSVVNIEYQLQRVLQGSPSSNTFSAPWLRDWSAPVKEMEIVFTFPEGFFVNSFHVTPHNLMGEGRRGGSEGETRRVTRACCGFNVTDEVEDMERCTSSNDMALVWDTLKGTCLDKTVMLSTLFSIPETEKEDGAFDDDVLKGFVEYKVSFAPGLVDDPWAPAVGDRDNWGVPWWGWIVVGALALPVLAAVFYTLASYGVTDFFLDQSAYKTKLQGKV